VTDNRTDPIDYWEEREAAKKVNGLYANHVYVQPLGQGMVRVNFGEVLDEEPRYHTAVVLTPENARDFAILMYQIAVRLAPEPELSPEQPQGTPNVSS